LKRAKEYTFNNEYMYTIKQEKERIKGKMPKKKIKKNKPSSKKKKEKELNF